MLQVFVAAGSDTSCGQSYKASTIVIYASRVVPYDRKMVIRLATDGGFVEICFWLL